MEENQRSLSSGPFLLEMIIVTGFFAVCAAVCLLVFAKANRVSARARNLNQAVLAAQNLAEEFRSQKEPALGTETLDGELFKQVSSWKQEETGTPRQEIWEAGDLTIYVPVFDRSWNRYGSMEELEGQGEKPGFIAVVYQSRSQGLKMTDIEIYEYQEEGHGSLLYWLSSDNWEGLE